MAQQQPYDPTGALGGLFAPAFIASDPISQEAVARWNAAHLRTRPPLDVHAQPAAPSQDTQRNAIVAAILGATPGATTDAGGLGLGGGGGVDPGNATPGTSVEDAAYGGSNHSGDPPSPATPSSSYSDPSQDTPSDTPASSAAPAAAPAGAVSGGHPADAPYGGPNTGVTDQDIANAQHDAQLAAADPVQGPTGPQGPNGTPNMGHNVGPGYGYGVQPANHTGWGAPAPEEAPAAPGAPGAPAGPAGPSAPAGPGATTGSIGPALDSTFGGGAPIGLSGMNNGIGFGGLGPGNLGAPGISIDNNNGMAQATVGGVPGSVALGGNEAAVSTALGGFGGPNGLGATVDGGFAGAGAPSGIGGIAGADTGTGSIGAPGADMPGSMSDVADGFGGGGNGPGASVDAMAGGNMGDVGAGLGGIAGGPGASGISGGNAAAVDTAMGDAEVGGSGLGTGGSGPDGGVGVGGMGGAMGGNTGAVDAAMGGFGW